MALRMCDLGLNLAGTWLEGRIAQLCADLKRRGLRFCPHTWLSHDWFSPDGVPGIAIPFYLAHPRLMRLEHRQIRQVEGGSREECMKILRHECGHAIQHAYQLQRRRRYQQLFGKSSHPYPESYRPNPASRHYVQHLPLYYAQSHPDEDFAETFAVWLQPRATWRRRYQAWAALKKLEYVDDVMSEIKQSRPVISSRKQIDPVHSLKILLRDYYADKRARYDLGYTIMYDRDLLRLFSSDPRFGNHDRASTFLRCHRREIRKLVGPNTRASLFALDFVLDEMIGRCRELKLRAVGSKRQLLRNFSVLLTVKTALFLTRRSNEIAL
ncbi:MAG TPA: putative zinc-binding metallopeptidase [Nitrospirales bacterium]